MTESNILWLVAVALVVVVFVPYFIKFRRTQKHAEARKVEATKLGIDRPRSQFPMIDRNSCIGCGSCVTACPEGDVLAVVWGRAEVVNGQRCVGHGYCEIACPVGALKVGMGDIKSRPDIPQLSGKNETTTPNLFIAGELSGISLIRHAITQGKMTANEIVHRCRANGSGSETDLIVVGAGPAGLSAALTAKSNGLSCVILDQYDVGGTILHYPRRKLVMTQPVEIPLYGKLRETEYSKETLMDIWQEISASQQLDVRPGVRISKITPVEDEIVLESDAGEKYRAAHVILALGRRGTPRKLNVEGEQLPKVLYSLVDAQSYSNKRILVVGGGDSAIEAAVGLARQNGNEVSLSYRKESLLRIKKKNQINADKMISAGKIKAFFSSQVKQIDREAVVLSTPNGDINLPNDYVFVLIGGEPPYDMLKAAGIAFGGESTTLADKDRQYAPSAAP